VVRRRSGLGWLWFGVRVAAGVTAAVRLLPGARRPADKRQPDRPTGSISAVVPARDEAGRLGPCVGALVADPGVAEVVVVDDESSDATADVAAALGARVVRGSPLPAGWAGKAWALQQGIEAAAGDWVVMVDADTEPALGLAPDLVAAAEGREADLVSAAGRFAVPTPGLRVLHPALLTTLVYRFGPPGRRTSRPARRLANGQCMAVRRKPFLAAGGFGLVAGSLVEDVAIARALAAKGWTVAFVDATDALLVRGAETAREAWRGWGRSLPLNEVTSRPWLLADLGVVWLAQAMPLVRLLARRADALDVVLLVLRAGTLAGTRRAYDRPGWWYWLSPLADVAAAARLTQVALRPERTWRGRTYAPPARSATR
jgi:dolichol-phosphate mannosyltransferase